MQVPSVKDRVDPASPHYDADFAALREAAYQAWNDHQSDLKNGGGKFRPNRTRRVA